MKFLLAQVTMTKESVIEQHDGDKKKAHMPISA